ncbi:hypothetical protein ACFQY7_52105 [Actinomadura luteofluorescens]|uniref:hypothetical protein n=1 Tax=Actinomadura luteofluorescens TaxID=46163 RepID=UPI003625812A
MWRRCPDERDPDPVRHGRASAASGLPSTIVRSGDKRYPALSRGFNQRWIGEPEYVRLVRSPEEARAALAEAVRERPADPRRTRITVKAAGTATRTSSAAPTCGSSWT